MGQAFREGNMELKKYDEPVKEVSLRVYEPYCISMNVEKCWAGAGRPPGRS